MIYKVKSDWKAAVIKKYNSLTFRVVKSNIMAHNNGKLVAMFDTVNNKGFIL